MSKRKFTTDCPECGSPVVFKSMPRLGQPVRCIDCRSDLEVISTRPLEVDLTSDAGDADAYTARQQAKLAAKQERRDRADVLTDS
jgi:transposase-like protein